MWYCHRTDQNTNNNNTNKSICKETYIVLISLIFTFFIIFLKYKFPLCNFPQSHRKYVKGYFHPDVSKNKIHFGKLKGDWQCYRYNTWYFKWFGVRILSEFWQKYYHHDTFSTCSSSQYVPDKNKNKFPVAINSHSVISWKHDTVYNSKCNNM